MHSGLRTVQSRAKAPLSAGLVLLLLLLQTLAASPVLHLDLHDEADSADHSCAITLFSQGQLDVTDPQFVNFNLSSATDSRPLQSSEPFLDSLFFSVDSSRGPPFLA